MYMYIYIYTYIYIYIFILLSIRGSGSVRTSVCWSPPTPYRGYLKFWTHTVPRKVLCS